MAMAAASVTLENVKKAVIKEGSDRLRGELKIGQKGITDAEILILDRKQLVSIIIALRVKAGQISAVRQEIIDFDYKKVPTIEGEMAELEVQKGEFGVEEKLKQEEHT